MLLVRVYGSDTLPSPYTDQAKQIRVIVADELSRTPSRRDINPPDPINPDTGIELLIFRMESDRHSNADLLIEIETTDTEMHRNLRTRAGNIHCRVEGLINQFGDNERTVLVFLKVVEGVWCK